VNLMPEEDPTHQMDKPLSLTGPSLQQTLLSESSDILFYLNLFGSYRPSRHDYSLPVLLWHYFISFSFLCYTFFFLLAGILAVYYDATEYWWVLQFITLLKCIALRVAIITIRKHFQSEVDSVFIEELHTSMNSSKLYFFVTEFANIFALSFYVAYYPNAAAVTFYLGSYAFTGYMATVVLVTIADARHAQRLTQSLIASASDGTLSPSVYTRTQARIESIAEKSFWIHGLLLIGMLCDALCIIIVAFHYNGAIDNHSVSYAVAFVLFVVVLICVPDAMFLGFICPEILQVNILATQLHRTLASAKWPAMSSKEINRHDTIQVLLAFPIQFKTAGVHLTKSELRNRGMGIALAISLSIVRVIVTLAISDG